MAVFNRENKQGWMIASSLACPKCNGRLHGDKTFIWCKDFECDFHCSWEGVDSVHWVNKKAIYSFDLTGSLHQITNDNVIIIFEGERDKKFEILRRSGWKE
jgi:hypothetical protein